MVQLTRDERHAALTKTIAIQFARAAGYELIENNINQWQVAVDMLLRGISEMIREDNAGTEVTMRHTDIRDG